MPPKTFAVILDYCGGSRTDRLYKRMAADNPGREIHVLDNASPRDRSGFVTHRNEVNSYVGGGIRDCVALAERAGCSYLFFLANDVRPASGVRIDEFERLMDEDEGVAQVSAALTPASDKVAYFPHMAARGGGVRTAPHADILACLLRLSFIREIGGFPPSLAGWGYDLELAFQARRLGKKILIDDRCVFEHSNTVRTLRLDSGLALDKVEEMRDVYRRKLGADYDAFSALLDSFDGRLT